MHCKVEKNEVDLMSHSPKNFGSNELCSVDIAPVDQLAGITSVCHLQAETPFLSSYHRMRLF